MSDSMPPKLPPELFLRIQCPRCLQFQAVSLADKPKSHPECHQCGGTIPLPRLNRNVRGLEVVLKAYPSPEPVIMRLPCPGCANFLTVSPEVAGQRRRCPECEVWFRLDLMKETLPNNPTGNQAHHDDGPETESSSPLSTAKAVFVEIDEEPYPTSRQHPPKERTTRTRQPTKTRKAVSASQHSSEHRRRPLKSPPPRPPHHPIDDWEDEEPADEDDFPVLTERSEMRYQSHVADDSKWPVLPLRLIYYTLLWSLRIVAPFLIMKLGIEVEELALCLVGLLFWIPFLRIPSRLASLIMSVCIPWIRCEGCRTVQSPVGRWYCECGYHSPREKNIFTFRCPACKKFGGHYNCPQCDSTTLIR